MIMDKKRETQKKMKIDFKNSFFYLHAFLLEDFLSVSCHRIAEQLLYIHISLRPLQYIMYYNVYEISSSTRGEFQSKTNVFHGFYNVLYSWRVY